MEISELYSIFRKCGSVTTDSRTVRGGELFFALKGENFDGNCYALKALEAGASYAVVSDPAIVQSSPADGEGNPRAILVEDTLKALQALARWHRSMMFVNGRPLPVIGLTGTNGKTTTKELIREVLSVRYKVTATEGNLNNSIGVPLTLLRISDSTEIAIVEMGASHPGDISELVSVALPNYGLITNVGHAHILGFGSFDGVMKAKGELYDYIQRTADRAFINVDNPYLCSMADSRPDLIRIPYGLHFEGASVLEVSSEHPYLRLKLKSGREVATSLIGDYNADNVMAAIAVGREFGITEEEAVAAISSYVPSNNRSQLKETGRNTLIVDAYNANPTSVAAALDSFANIAAERKMILLGNMLELGKDSAEEHRKVVEKVASMGVRAYFVGPEFRDAAEGAGMPWAETSDRLAEDLREENLCGYTVLIKGSRGSRMENVIPVL